MRIGSLQPFWRSRCWSYLLAGSGASTVSLRSSSCTKTYADDLDLDLTALTILTHGPYYFFLYTFYNISPATSFTYLAIDIIALAAPFRLLRPKAPAHNAAAPASAVPNKSVINDSSIRALTTLLPAAIYGVVIYGSFALWLTAFLAPRFTGLKTFENAHNVVLPALITYAIPLGWSARTFLFSPSTAARPNLANIRQAGFNPETATLGETFAHNIWGWNLRTKVLIKRTAILMLMQGLNCWLRIFVTVEGSEGIGAAGWAAMWITATALVGFSYQWAADI